MFFLMVYHFEDCGKIPLVDILDNIKYPNERYYWFDFKNSKHKHIVDASVEKFKEIIEKYNLKSKYFIESRYTYCLKKMKKHGLNAVYWTPGLRNNTTEEKERVVKEIKGLIEQGNPIGLSAHYKSFSFLKEYMPDADLNFWTNGLITEDDKRIIRELEEYPKTRVVLTDYPEPFE